MEARSILIVDDDADGRAWVQGLLEARGYETVLAEDGSEALARARLFHPNLILLDMRMPVMDGRAFRAAQVHDPDIADIPIVCMSAEHDIVNVARSLDAAACLRKPVDPAELLDMIDELGAHHPQLGNGPRQSRDAVS